MGRMALLGAGPQSAAAGGGVNLTTNVSAYYRMEETGSANRVDQTVNALHLSATNAPGNGTGKIGNALSPTVVINGQSTNAFVSRAHDTLLDMTASDFTVACWINPNVNVAANTQRWIVSKGYQGNFDHSWALSLWNNGSQNRASLMIPTDTSHSNTGVMDNTVDFATASTGVWYCIVGTFAASTKVASISVNGASYVTSTMANTTPSASGDLLVCRYPSGVSNDFGFNGLVDCLTIVKGEAWSSTKKDAYYNSGSGVEVL